MDNQLFCLQKVDGSNCSVCGMLAKQLLQNPMMMVSSPARLEECAICINYYSVDYL